MSTHTLETTNAGLLARTLAEGYGPGAWHGADLKAALADVDDRQAFVRPSPERHNIAEVALHHAFCARTVREKLTGRPAAPFILAGDDWFALSGNSPLSWQAVRDAVEAEQRQLADTDAQEDALQQPQGVQAALAERGVERDDRRDRREERVVVVDHAPCDEPGDG